MEFLQYFGGVFEPLSFALLVFGTIGGLILGATPGLNDVNLIGLYDSPIGLRQEDGEKNQENYCTNDLCADTEAQQ